MFEQQKRIRMSDAAMLSPSPVIHVRNIPMHTLELDLINQFGTHGKIREVTMMPQRRQALVEFESLADAEALIDQVAKNPVHIRDQEIHLSFSKSQRIIQRGADKNSSTDEVGQSTENHILLFTVYNAHHQITIDVLKRITSQFADIVRVVLFRKKQTQAMVEFRNVDDARLVKRNLNGADIFSGCCTLKVDYARPTRLTVTRNDADSWDFEQSLATGYTFETGQKRSQPDSLLGAYNFSDSVYPNGQHVPPVYPNDRCLINTPQFDAPQSFSPVIMVYNLDAERMNCDRLFNLFCPYGNVVRIKFLRSSETSAMVQMADTLATDRVIENLSGVTLMGNRLSIRPSRQTEVLEMGQTHTLPDSTPSFKDYSFDRNNRYSNPTLASKNRWFKPSQTLHYWNCPPNFTLNDMSSICSQLEAPIPNKLLAYTKTTGRSSSGLVQWEREEDALAALVITNHHDIPNPDGGLPFKLKLSFAVEIIRD